MITTLKAIRLYEIERIRPFIKTDANILELGGGDGYQAGILAGWGFQVVSLDVAEHPISFSQHYRVQTYDGAHIPFADQTFDVVFSSNVLEHVNLPSLISREIHRILKPGGIAIHILPSTVWRFWTILTHYPNLVLSRFRENDPASFGEKSPGIAITGRSLTHRLVNLLIPPAHGEYPNSFLELYTYSRRRWEGVFQCTGFLIQCVLPIGLFYTGHLLFLNLSIAWRHTFSKLLGSSGTIFILKKSA